jgi:hypothetical protein
MTFRRSVLYTSSWSKTCYTSKLDLILDNFLLGLLFNPEDGDSTVTCYRDFRRGFRLETEFILHFNTQSVTMLNYSAIANFHTLEITSAHAKSFPASIVFTRRFLVTASNNSYSSASRLKSSLNGGSLPTASSCSN